MFAYNSNNSSTLQSYNLNILLHVLLKIKYECHNTRRSVKITYFQEFLSFTKMKLVFKFKRDKFEIQITSELNFNGNFGIFPNLHISLMNIIQT